MQHSAEIRSIWIGCRGLARSPVFRRELLGFVPVERSPGAVRLDAGAGTVAVGVTNPRATVAAMTDAGAAGLVTDPRGLPLTVVSAR
jgi:hypothetical protein